VWSSCPPVLSGCGGQSASSPPAKQPTSDVDVEFHEPEAAETEETNTEAAKPEAGKAEPAKSETNSNANAPKKGCAGLKQDTCQITMGCAWSTKKVCVDQ
jgi:hypothetical protein